MYESQHVFSFEANSCFYEIIENSGAWIVGAFGVPHRRCSSSESCRAGSLVNRICLFTQFLPETPLGVVLLQRMFQPDPRRNFNLLSGLRRTCRYWAKLFLGCDQKRGEGAAVEGVDYLCRLAPGNNIM